MLNPPRLVAADTNVALDFARGVDDVCDAIATIRARVAGVELILPPTVVEELVHAFRHNPDSEVGAAATKLLRQHRAMGFRPVNFVPLGRERIEGIAQVLRHRGLLPEEEVNDSIILCEASALGCALLTSSDAELRAIDHQKLARELNQFDLNAPVIATPREIVKKFFR